MGPAPLETWPPLFLSARRHGMPGADKSQCQMVPNTVMVSWSERGGLCPVQSPRLAGCERRRLWHCCPPPGPRSEDDVGSHMDSKTPWMQKLHPQGPQAKSSQKTHLLGKVDFIFSRVKSQFNYTCTVLCHFGNTGTQFNDSNFFCKFFLTSQVP